MYGNDDLCFFREFIIHIFSMRPQSTGNQKCLQMMFTNLKFNDDAIGFSKFY
jgi:hypothetical protein